MAMCFGSLGLQDAASTSALFVSSSVMSSFSRSSELYSVNFVFSSMFSSSELQAFTKPSISPSHGVVTKPEKVYFVLRKQSVNEERERGEERRRHESSTKR